MNRPVARSLVMVLIAACASAGVARPTGVLTAPDAADIRGAWLGAISARGRSVRLGLRIEGAEGQALDARFRQIDPKVTEVPLPAIEFDGTALRFSLAKPNASYAGALEDGQLRFVGVWRQGGAEYPLVFERVESLPDATRPQDPCRPLPYDEQDVRIETARGVTLAGTLTRPIAAGAHPALLLVSGSGAQDRDESVFGHRPFLVLSDALTRSGFAVLRLDDRGVGGSTGDLFNSTLDELAEDVIGAVEFLAARTDLDPNHIGVIGHSEGGLVATLAAAKTGRITRVCLLATPALPIREVREMQTASIGRSQGASDAAIEAIRAFNREAFDAAAAGVDGDSLNRRLSDAGRRLLSAIPDNDRPHYTALVQDLVTTAVGYSTPWFRSLLNFQPSLILQSLRCPSLVLFGGKDTQVDADANHRALLESLDAEARARCQIIVLPSLNHMLQTARTGGLDEYVLIDETASPEVLALIREWFREGEMPSGDSLPATLPR